MTTGSGTTFLTKPVRHQGTTRQFGSHSVMLNATVRALEYLIQMWPRPISLSRRDFWQLPAANTVSLKLKAYHNSYPQQQFAQFSCWQQLP